MKKQIHVKPSRSQSALGFIVGLVFCMIGIFVAIPGAGLFGVFWTLIAAAITVMHGINLFSEKGLSTSRIEVDEEDSSFEAYSRGEANGGMGRMTQKGNGASVEERLEQLNRLYEQRLITKEDFDAKKAEILKDL